jgi:hypothetical protein
MIKIFISLAEHEAIFYNKICQKLNINNKINAVQITFHEGAYNLLKKNKYIYNIFENANSKNNFKLNKEIKKKFLHEQVVYHINDKNIIKKKFLSYTSSISYIVEKIKLIDKNISFFQEIGGFTPHWAVYYYAKKHKINHYFIEPSFFNNRLFIIKNNFNFKIKLNKKLKLSNNCKEIFCKLKNSKEIISAYHLKHKYNSPTNKIFFFRNYIRLMEKILFKYIKNQNEEFKYIRTYLYNFIKTIYNYYKLKNYYKDLNYLNKNKKIIFYPFHVPVDFSLTIRSPDYLDQIKTLDKLSGLIDSKYQIIIKEHPSMIGSISSKEIINLLKKNKKILLLNPYINSKDIIKSSDAVITINSKVGIEALLYGKMVISLGTSFYEECPLIYKINSINEIKKCLKKKKIYSQSVVLKYLNSIWNKSYSGSLFNIDQNNINTLIKSIKKLK